MEIKVIKPPMTGRITEVMVSDGDEISAGDMLLVLESMKMENEIYSEYSGTVAKVHVKELQNVAEDDPLIDVQIS